MLTRKDKIEIIFFMILAAGCGYVLFFIEV